MDTQSIAGEIIRKVCNEHCSSDLRADNRDVIAALDAKFEETSAVFGDLNTYVHTINLNVPQRYRQPQLELSIVRMRDAIQELEKGVAKPDDRPLLCVIAGGLIAGAASLDTGYAVQRAFEIMDQVDQVLARRAAASQRGTL